MSWLVRILTGGSTGSKGLLPAAAVDGEQAPAGRREWNASKRARCLPASPAVA
jgi:hypothetical protein